MTSGHYVSIQSFRKVYTVLQTALVKLIVIMNCKDLNHFFWLAAASPTCVAKVTYILVLAENISLFATEC